MIKAELNEIMIRNTMSPCEIDDAIAFVAELLEHQMEELSEKEPYATRTIRNIENAAGIVWDLQNYVSEVEDDEDED